MHANAKPTTPAASHAPEPSAAGSDTAIPNAAAAAKPAIAPAATPAATAPIQLKAYSGLIRNHAQLATELHVDTSGCTRTEREEKLMIAAYQTWGTHMGDHINGQFAAAFYNTQTHELFCLRDPLGAEILFYYQTADGALLVGTQIKDLFDQPGFKRQFNQEMLQFYLAFNYVPGEETLFKGVWKLAPGGYLTFSEQDGLATGQWWQIAFTPDESKTLDDWADALSNAMDASLHDIRDADEHPDSFLSGGVDSSYILAKSQAQHAFCVSYANQKASEADQARATAELLHRDFKAVEVTPTDFFATLDEFLLAYEQPSADVAGLSLFTACKEVAQTSTLCFSGEGADEFFAGYSTYSRAERYKFQPGAVYYGCTYIMNAKEQRRFLKRYYPEKSTKAFAKERFNAKRNSNAVPCNPNAAPHGSGSAPHSPDTVTKMLAMELQTYFEASILFNSNKIVRGTGLDIRMPYCDLRIFDIALHMPSRYKVNKQGNKLALRKAASQVLPHEIAYRTKLGFPVPVRDWLSDPAYNKDIYRAFKSPVADQFFSRAELDALLVAFEGKKPAVHALWFKRRQSQLWRYIWTIYTFIRWYELFFEDPQI